VSAASIKARLARLWRALCWRASVFWFGHGIARVRAGHPLPPPPPNPLRDEIMAMVFAKEEDEPPPS
jgi:hypothetical protein